MKLNNPFLQIGEFLTSLVLISVAIGCYLFGQPGIALTFLVVAFLTFIVLFINLLFIKNIKVLKRKKEVEHLFKRNIEELKYVNGIPLSTGYQYDYSLEKDIETYSYEGLLFGIFVQQKIISEKRIIIKDMTENKY